MSSWIWIVAGIVLLALEILAPGGIFMLFFGAAALVVGTLVSLGVGGPVWFQLALFSLLSVVSLLSLRGPILRRMEADGHDLEVDTLVGRAVTAAASIEPGAEGKVELRGTSWSAENIGDASLPAGAQATVERVDGLKLFVRRNGP
ncbi:MAG: NfeD family protein [Thermoanaerobaculia bacterium]|nr:NfeD family protein [Thermoanaerobaculia bacterium]